MLRSRAIMHGGSDSQGTPEPAGLYIHVPFCSAICPYCDFAVLVGGHDKRRRFVDTLIAEIELHSATQASWTDPQAGPFDSIYFGGGTPSLLEPEDIKRILGAIRRLLRPAPHARVYLEANPEDVDRTNIEAWRLLGIGTISLGVQSFDEDELRFLGRRHDASTAQRSVELALDAGFETVSVDLIYGLPGQDEASWKTNLEIATAALAPQHLSCYELEIHERTTFGKRYARGELETLADSRQADLFLFTHRFLELWDYAGYEVSNFARGPEHRSRHNQKYWHHVPYLGIGPSAHSFDGRYRWWNERSLAPWERAVRTGKVPEAGREELGRREMALETVMLALRTQDGIELTAFERRFGFDLSTPNRELIEQSITDGLLLRRGDRLMPTLNGLAVADRLAASFEITR